MFESMMLLMFKDITQGRNENIRLFKAAETNINTKLAAMQSEMKRDMSDFADGMRKESGSTAKATLEAANKHTKEKNAEINKMVIGANELMGSSINETFHQHSTASDAKQAQWQIDNHEFIKNEISQHVRHYAGHEKRIRTLEGRKAK